MSNGNDLMDVIKRDNEKIIENINASKGPVGGCDSCPPLKAGAVRTIELLEIVLERDLHAAEERESLKKEVEVIIERGLRAKTERENIRQSNSNSFADILQVGKLRVAGLPALIIAVAIATVLIQYYQGKRMEESTKEIVAQEVKSVISKTFRP